MKGRLRNKSIPSYKKKIYLLLLAAAGVVASYYLFVSITRCSNFLLEKFFDVKHISVEFKSIYSASVKTELQSCIEQTFADKNLFLFKFDQFADGLKQKFSVIKDISWQQKSFDKALLQIEGHKPAYLVNDVLVLLRHGVLVEKKLFTEFSDPLVSLSIAQAEQKNQENLCHILTFADGLNPFVWTDYDLTYDGPSEIFLVPKQQHSIKQEIVTDEKTAFSFSDKQRIASVIKDMIQKKAYPTKKNSKIVFDVRLRNRVLVKIFDGAKSPFLQKRRGA